jgi:hypothetical protein
LCRFRHIFSTVIFQNRDIDKSLLVENKELSMNFLNKLSYPKNQFKRVAPVLLGVMTVLACSDGSTDTISTAATTTAGVLCNYAANVFNGSASVNATSTSTWSCTSTKRNLTANGLPDHDVGAFPNANNPNAIAAQSITASLNLSPSYSGAVRVLGGAAGGAGYVLNGVKIDAATAGTCNDGGSVCDAKGNVGSWKIEAVNSGFNFGTDSNNAHVQPGGTYHYHGMPEGFVTKLGKGATMTLIGWAVDGFPIYARYGYATATSASSSIKVVTSSYRLKSSVPSNRAPTSQYKLGTFEQDYEYVSGLGDLDECNGRYGVTPEFPSGTYHYFATDTYPFLQRCVKGNV